MDKELKETLSKVADYNKLEKERVTKVGNIAFGLTFAICAAVIIIQLLMVGELVIVAGETAVLLVGVIGAPPFISLALLPVVEYKSFIS